MRKLLLIVAILSVSLVGLAQNNYSQKLSNSVKICFDAENNNYSLKMVKTTPVYVINLGNNDEMLFEQLSKIREKIISTEVGKKFEYVDKAGTTHTFKVAQDGDFQKYIFLPEQKGNTMINLSNIENVINKGELVRNVDNTSNSEPISYNELNFQNTQPGVFNQFSSFFGIGTTFSYNYSDNPGFMLQAKLNHWDFELDFGERVGLFGAWVGYGWIRWIDFVDFAGLRDYMPVPCPKVLLRTSLGVGFEDEDYKSGPVKRISPALYGQYGIGCMLFENSDYGICVNANLKGALLLGGSGGYDMLPNVGIQLFLK